MCSGGQYRSSQASANGPGLTEGSRVVCDHRLRRRPLFVKNQGQWGNFRCVSASFVVNALRDSASMLGRSATVELTFRHLAAGPAARSALRSQGPRFCSSMIKASSFNPLPLNIFYTVLQPPGIHSAMKFPPRARDFCQFRFLSLKCLTRKKD